MLVKQGAVDAPDQGEETVRLTTQKKAHPQTNRNIRAETSFPVLALVSLNGIALRLGALKGSSSAACSPNTISLFSRRLLAPIDLY